jgi:hypothetical protein
MRPYRDYLEQDVQFDCSEAYRLLKVQNLELPTIDSREVDRLIALAHRNAVEFDPRRLNCAFVP